MKETHSFKPNLRKIQIGIDPTQLSAFQRILLITDGSLTDLLEVYLLEDIKVIKLSEQAFLANQPIIELGSEANDEIIERKTLLQGKISKKNWLYAESIIVPSRLAQKFKEDLLKSKRPIGKLWVKHRVETFKEVTTVRSEIAGGLAEYFKIDEKSPLLYRTYRVFTHRQPVMLITEKFPAEFFR